MLHKSTQHSTIGYVTDGSVTAFAAGRAPDEAGRAQSGTARMVLSLATAPTSPRPSAGSLALPPSTPTATRPRSWPSCAPENPPRRSWWVTVSTTPPAPAAAGVGVAWPPAGRPRRPRWLMWCSPRTGWRARRRGSYRPPQQPALRAAPVWW